MSIDTESILEAPDAYDGNSDGKDDLRRMNSLRDNGLQVSFTIEWE